MTNAHIGIGILALCVAASPLPTAGQDDPCPQREYGWTIATGAAGFDQARGIAVDGEGNVYVGGMFEQRVDFDPGKDKHYHRAKQDTNNGYIASYDHNGSYRWSWDIANRNKDRQGLLLIPVTLVPEGTIAYGGAYMGRADFDPGNKKDVHRSTPDDHDGFVSLLGTDGRYAWTATFSGLGRCFVLGLSADRPGNIVATGHFEHTIDLDPGREVDKHLAQGIGDALVVKLTPEGSLCWGRTWGGPDSFAWGSGASADVDGNVVVSGHFTGRVDFDPGPGEDWRDSAGEWDGFVIKFDPDGTRQWAATFGGTGWDAFGMKVAADLRRNVYYTSEFEKTVDLDPTDGVDWRTSNGKYDIFVSSLGPEVPIAGATPSAVLSGTWVARSRLARATL